MSHSEAGIRELKTHLSAYLRRVKEGETITITEHGTPIGRIVPEEKSLKGKMEALQEAGMLKWSGKKFAPRKPAAKVRGERSVADLLLEDRR